MRLEPAGCSGLRVGPPKLAPKIFEKRVGNLARFRSSFVSEQIQKVIKIGSQMDPKLAQQSGN